MDKKRCDWVPLEDPLYLRYHDEEWGVPVHAENRLFEFLILEGAQSGLSWRTVLYKREDYRRAFNGFSPGKVASFNDEKIEQILNNPGIIRNKAKVLSAINNASRFMEIQEEFGSFNTYIWNFVSGNPIDGRVSGSTSLPAYTDLSVMISRDLKSRGFTFVGPVVCYSFMQAVGMVNDHATYCFRYSEILKNVQ